MAEFERTAQCRRFRSQKFIIKARARGKGQKFRVQSSEFKIQRYIIKTRSET